MTDARKLQALSEKYANASGGVIFDRHFAVERARNGRFRDAVSDLGTTGMRSTAERRVTQFLAQNRTGN
jgi:hypothetical protein